MEVIDIADAELRFEELIDEVEQGKNSLLTKMVLRWRDWFQFRNHLFEYLAR